MVQNIPEGSYLCLSISLIIRSFFTTYDDQKIKDHHCTQYPPDNTDISGSYFGSILTTYEDGFQAIIDSKAFFQNEYTEIKRENIFNQQKYRSDN